MGLDEWEVECWVNVDGNGYRWMQSSTGNSRREMKRAVKEARRNDVDCIRVTRRRTS